MEDGDTQIKNTRKTFIGIDFDKTLVPSECTTITNQHKSALLGLISLKKQYGENVIVCIVTMTSRERVFAHLGIDEKSLIFVIDKTDVISGDEAEQTKACAVKRWLVAHEFEHSLVDVVMYDDNIYHLRDPNWHTQDFHGVWLYHIKENSLLFSENMHCVLFYPEDDHHTHAYIKYITCLLNNI